MTEASALIRDLPDPGSARRFLDTLAEKHPRHAAKLEKNRSLLSDVVTLAAFSPLLAATMLEHPEYLAWLGRKRGESVVRDKEELLESLARFSLTNSQLEPHVVLARFRRRELLRIFLQDIRRLAAIAEITEEISNLADAILEHALRLARQELDNRFGTPLETDDKGRQKPAEICIVSLGKLGSRELNYASDIDLLFLYSAEGTTSGIGTREPVTNREYFIKLAETVTALVGRQTGEGAAYRVDLRLRPHGRVGPLAMSLAETVRYYNQDAAAWERQVLIRCRASAGDGKIFRGFYNSVSPAVFSADVSVDAALAAVRDSKQKIDLQHIAAKGTDVKLGRGGIREIEFIAQALQLAHGGRDRWLRSPHTLISLTRLADRRLLGEHELTALYDAYDFLRKLEHLLQMENGLQTHLVPRNDERRAVIARRMAFAELAAFDEALQTHLHGVHRVFRRVFGDAETAPASAPNDHAPAIGIRVAAQEAYGSSTGEESDAISEITRAAPRFGELFAVHRDAIEDALREPTDADPPDHRSILLAAIGTAEGHGGHLAKLRQTWSRELARIAALDAAGRLTIRESKNRQTRLAEASIKAAMEITRREAGHRMDMELDSLPLAVLALGKLGGAGVDYDSDLDLVLVYSDEETRTMQKPARSKGTEFENPHGFRAEVSPAEFYARAAGIFVNTLSAMTRDGSLYRVDLRLRPHGKDGPLALPRDTFIEYMEQNAAIWELLAFVKIRGVGGDADMARTTEQAVREAIHRRALDAGPGELAAETRRVRLELERRRAGRGRRGGIDIKYGQGGMLDIYFALRYLQLRDDLPDTGDSRSTERTLERLRDVGSLSAGHFAVFAAGYELLSALDHALRLAVGRTTRLPLAKPAVLAIIAGRTGHASADELLSELTTHRLAIRSAFDEITK